MTISRVDRGEESSRASTGRFSQGFLEFWNVYPRKQSKLDAWKAYQKALKSTDESRILAGVRAYALVSIGKDKNFIKLAGGWLRDERWEDELFAPPSEANQRPLTRVEQNMLHTQKLIDREREQEIADNTRSTTQGSKESQILGILELGRRLQERPTPETRALTTLAIPTSEFCAEHLGYPMPCDKCAREGDDPEGARF